MFFSLANWLLIGRYASVFCYFFYAINYRSNYRVSILGDYLPSNSGTAGRNGMKIEPQVEGNNPFL